MSLPPARRSLTVWIVNPYGWLPGEAWRDYRSVPLADALAARGHSVCWWVSDIEHRSRTRRSRTGSDRTLPSGAFIEMVETRSYDRNISLGRILYERSFAAGFARRSGDLPEPDVIVLGEPALFFAGPVADYARHRDIPLVVDGIDLWPEMFHLALPKRLQAFGNALFAPLYRRRDKLVARAAAVVAVTADYLERLTRRTTAPVSDVIYLGVDRSLFPAPRFDWEGGAPLKAIYAGNLGDAYDMPVLLAAIERLVTGGRPVHFTFAGAGPWEADVAALGARFPEQVRFLGRVAPETLPALYAQAEVGLATYSAGSTVSMPTKLFDYLAGGLAIVGSMGGEAEALLRSGAGRTYRAGLVDDLVAILEGYAGDRVGLEQARRYAYAQAARFDLAAQYERYARVIETVADR